MEKHEGDAIYDEARESAVRGQLASTLAPDPKHDLHRGLKARHIAMIAIGGAIGTGLLIGTGSALALAGPASILIAYSAVGIVVALVMAALAEMAAYNPHSSGFSGFASRYVDDALGCALGYTYWFKYIIITPNQLTASALVLQYWVPASKVNPGVFITVFLVLILLVNYFGVKIFGEFEFWLSSLKVIVIVGVIITLVFIAAGATPAHDVLGFKYWNNPGAFNTYLASGAEGRFLAFWAVLTSAVFAYLGTELIGVTVGEARSPQRVIPRAIKLTFFRILVFYIFSIFLLGMCVPYNSPQLLGANKAGTSATASPFVVAIVNAQIPYLPAILNGGLLIFTLSASNSDLYIASRTIFGLAVQGKAPRFLARTDKRGVPIYALGSSAIFCLLAYLNVSTSSATVFKYFVNLVTIFGLLTWISILIAHIGFMKICKAQGVDRKKDLPYHAPFQPYGSWIAMLFCCLISFFKGFDTIAPTFNVSDFITSYLGIPLYLIIIVVYKIVYKTERVRPETADITTGRAEIDKDNADYADREANKTHEKGFGKFYKRYISWLF